jgi:hypothetical protein
MVARDDSVIRGSLIASLIFLVLSLAVNFFFWKWGNTQALEAQRANDQLANANDALRKKTSQADLMKAMLGAGQVSEATFQVLRESVGGDPEMEAIEKRYVQDMAYFGPEVDAANRNYPALPEFLVNAIRGRNDQYGQAVTEATTVRKQADSDVENARKAQTEAETVRDNTIAKLDKATTEFTEDRARMKQTGEETKDSLNKTVGEFQKFQKVAQVTENKLTADASKLKDTIENQRQELNRLRSDNFENVQGEIQFVVPPGDLVLINLGSSHALRAGVQFGVIAADSTNLQEAPVKAQIEVVKVVNANTSQARVIGPPSYRDPLIAGDKIYSPFWAPGRKVRIALAGEIDIDGDGRSDVEQLKSMIELAGAEVAAVISKTGGVEGELDSSVRFLVIGEQPSLGGPLDTAESEADAAFIAELGRYKAEAVEKGVTVIPAWKLQAYLKSINDSVTTPLGSAVRGEDFPPDAYRGNAGKDLGSVLPEIYRNQVGGQ